MSKRTRGKKSVNFESSEGVADEPVMLSAAAKRKFSKSKARSSARSVGGQTLAQRKKLQKDIKAAKSDLNQPRLNSENSQSSLQTKISSSSG